MIEIVKCSDSKTYAEHLKDDDLDFLFSTEYVSDMYIEVIVSTSYNELVITAVF